MPYRIALTGGPAAGKTSALQSAKEALEEDGWEVRLVAEAATDLFASGWQKENLADDDYERRFYEALVQTELDRESEASAQITNPAR